MGAADCLSEEQLAAYATGVGDPADAGYIDAHLEECSRCRERLDARKFDPGFLANVRAAAREEAEDDVLPPSVDSFDNESARDRTSFPDIPGYRIRREVGRGGMGVVFEAIQTKLNRSVALKVLAPMMAKISSTAVTRFRAEASAAARLRHNNIIPIYDFGESQGAYYYAMELIEGEPLSEVIQSLAAGDALAALPTNLTKLLTRHQTNRVEHFDGLIESESVARPDGKGSTDSSSTATSRAYYRQVARWMRDVADALHYAHGKGIIHRDIKPANLILANDGRMMVADFGLAKSSGSESVTMTGSLVGTWRYMSPEQALAKRMPVDHRTDIYSLAATMYELLTFRPAFPGSDEKEIISKVITEEPVRPRKIIRSVPAELETICLKAMEKSQDARYSNAAAFADEFRRFLNDLPIVAKPPGPIIRVRKFAKRHRGAVSLTVALVLFLASLGGLIFVRYAREGMRRNNIETALKQGNAYMEQANWVAAGRSFNEALSLDSQNIQAIGNLARFKKDLYNSMTDPDRLLLEEANDLCDRALQLDERREYYSDLRNLKGVLLKKLGRYDEAVEALLQAHAFDETDTAPVINLGPYYALNDELDKASRWFHIAEQMLSDPSILGEDEHACLHQNLGAFLLFHRNPAASQHLATAHDCRRGFVPNLTLRARACLELGGCDDQCDAVYFAQLADYNANEQQAATAKRILALAYLRDEAYPLAVKEATAAFEFGDLETADRLILALAYAKLGDRPTANTHLTLAREHWPDTLDEPGEYEVEAPAGYLWFESADELLALRDEVETLLAVPRP